MCIGNTTKAAELIIRRRDWDQVETSRRPWKTEWSHFRRLSNDYLRANDKIFIEKNRAPKTGF